MRRFRQRPLRKGRSGGFDSTLGEAVEVEKPESGMYVGVVCRSYMSRKDRGLVVGYMIVKAGRVVVVLLCGAHGGWCGMCVGSANALGAEGAAAWSPHLATLSSLTSLHLGCT